MQFNEEIEKKLTKRESMIVKLMILGYSNYDIASNLEVSSSLVKIMLSKVFLKLNAKNRANACYILGLATKQ